MAMSHATHLLLARASVLWRGGDILVDVSGSLFAEDRANALLLIGMLADKREEGDRYCLLLQYSCATLMVSASDREGGDDERSQPALEKV
jgi:hypothetical protein